MGDEWGDVVSDLMGLNNDLRRMDDKWMGFFRIKRLRGF